jgi:hypothetical protein
VRLVQRVLAHRGELEDNWHRAHAGAPTWPNGFDAAPDWLRREIEEAGTLTREVAA